MRTSAENKAYLDAAARELEKKLEKNGFFTGEDVREVLGIGETDYPFKPEFCEVKPYVKEDYKNISVQYDDDRIAVVDKVDNTLHETTRERWEHMGPLPIKVIFHDPATIVYWADDTKTVVKCQEGDTYRKETGLALCVMKKVYGNTGLYNKIIRACIKEGESHEDD